MEIFSADAWWGIIFFNVLFGEPRVPFSWLMLEEQICQRHRRIGFETWQCGSANTRIPGGWWLVVGGWHGGACRPGGSE